MLKPQKYEPYWPENVIFWGAGATHPLNMKSTAEIGNALSDLAGLTEAGEKPADLKANIRKALPDISENVLNELHALLVIIDSDHRQDNISEYARILRFKSQRLDNLQRLYDWHAVKLVIERCPKLDGNKINLQDLYNLIDMHIKSQRGLEIRNEFVTLDRLIAARRTVDMLSQVFHAVGFCQLLEEDSYRKIYKQYYQFAKILAKLMTEEGLEKKNDYAINNREFYLFSYAVISMNWDPLLLWLIFNAHKEANDSKLRPYIGTPPQPMKLFNDLAHFMAVRAVDGVTPEAWFPMNETAVQRLNDPAHSTGRRVRIGKFYFPHGCHGFRECPKCGKLTFYLGNEWDIFSESLFPPQILPSLSPQKARSFEEQEAINEGVYDAVQCTHCGTITEAHHTPIIVQTNFKGANPSFIEEIQIDMKVAIEKADHLIFAGYSLPNDDFIYRSILAARRKMGDKPVKCSVIGWDKQGSDKWLEGKELDTYLQSHKELNFAGTCQRVIDIFGKENVRGYNAGFPQVFLKKDRADKEKLRELLWYR